MAIHNGWYPAPITGCHSIITLHQQKLHLLHHHIYLVHCTHKLKRMKSRFPWNMALLDCPTVFFESSRYCSQGLRLVYPLLRMWQRALDKRFPLPLGKSQFISRHTPTLPNLISPRNDDSSHSICLLKCVVLVFKDTHGFNLTNHSHHAEVVHYI